MKTPLQRFPVYKKAVELYSLSRKLTAYMTHNKDLKKLYYSADDGERNLEMIVVASLELAPGVALAKTSNEDSKQQYHLKRLKRITSKIKDSLKNVKLRNQQDKDYVNLFKQELRYFQSLLKQWSISIAK